MNGRENIRDRQINEELNTLNFRNVESVVPIRTKVEHLALSKNLGVISADERESVWNEKNSWSRADPENQQNIRGLQKMICSEGAVRESRLEPKSALPPEVMGVVGGEDFKQQCH